MGYKRKTPYDCNCPYCGKQLGYDKAYMHFKNYCQKKEKSTLCDFLTEIYGNDVKNAVELYKQGYSINELVQDKRRALFPNIPLRPFVEILKEAGLYRNSSESLKEQRRKEKFKNTCITKYGVSNPSKLNEIKHKKCQTFLKHYGVDNIWKCEWWNKFQTDLMLERYGTKRISGFSGKTKEQKFEINKKRFITKAQNGFYDSTLEERVEFILKNNGIEYERPYFLYHHPYDFLIGKNENILLEINGDYWHANPKKYKATDIFAGGKTALDIWSRDKKFSDCLTGTKWKLYYLWEMDMIKMSDDEILSFIQGLRNENKINNKT